jgi:hypothetical protein
MNEFQVFGLIISVLLSVVAFFTKQLHSDFKRVEKDLAEVKTTTSLVKTEFKGIVELINQRLAFLESRIEHIESILFKTNHHGKEWAYVGPATHCTNPKDFQNISDYRTVFGCCRWSNTGCSSNAGCPSNCCSVYDCNRVSDDGNQSGGCWWRVKTSQASTRRLPKREAFLFSINNHNSKKEEKGKKKKESFFSGWLSGKSKEERNKW